MAKKIFTFLIIFLIVFGFWIFNFRKTEKVEAAPDTVTLYPSGAGADTNLTPVPAGRANWDCVDETPADDTDYVYATTAFVEKKDIYSTLSPNVPTGSTITSVKVYWRAKEVTAAGSPASSGRPRVRALAQTITEGTSVYLTTSWVLRSQTWTTNPQTGVAWTVNEVNDLDIGVGLKYNSVDQPQCSQVYAEIDYTPPAAFDFSLSANPTSGSVAQGDSITTAVTATLTSGTTQSVNFSCSGLPSGASCSFSPTSCNPTCSSTLTISTLSTTPAGTYSVTISGTGGLLTRTTPYSLTVTAVGVPVVSNVSGYAWSENIGWIKFKGKIPMMDLAGLVAGYTLNENGGTIINDSSVNDNDGTIYDNEGDQWTNGPYDSNSALRFDGVNDYAGVVPNPLAPPPNLNITNAISIEAWIKGSPAGFTSISKSGSAADKTRLQFQVVGDKIYYVWEEPDASGYDQIWTGEMKVDGTNWQYEQRTKAADGFRGNSAWPLNPQLQVVGNKIYYVWVENDAVTGWWELWTAELDLTTNTWSVPPTPRRNNTSGLDIFNSQFQVDIGKNKIFFVWVEDYDGGNHWGIHTGELNLATNNFTATLRDPPMYVFGSNVFPQLQVKGNKIYYVFPGRQFLTSLYDQIWTAELDLTTNTWSANERTNDISSPYLKLDPQLQVVGNKIYYIWRQCSVVTESTTCPGGDYQIWTGEFDIGTNSWSVPIQRTTSASNKYNPQLQVVGDKIYYVWVEGGNIWTAEMKTDGSGWSVAQRTATAGGYPQFQIVGSKSYYTWAEGNNIYTGEMNSNIINKGDFYGLGVSEYGEVVGFINAGVDGFKYKGEAISQTAGAVVSTTYDSTKWYHVVFTYDKISLKLYLNEAGTEGTSIPVATFNFSDNIKTNLFPLIIGDDFNGIIDEIRIYNIALSGDKVLEHFNSLPYGVHLCESETDSFCSEIPAPKTGKLKGYAWSGHIGWISFNSAELTGCPSGACEAKVDLTSTGSICGKGCSDTGATCTTDADCTAPATCKAGWTCGWARALSYGDGWEGWIKLKGTATDGSPYGVWLDTTVTLHQFRGWAWGEEVVGWISFNCADGGYDEGTGEHYSVCGTSDYKVITSFLLNFKPTASDLNRERKDCDVLPKVGQVSFDWLYQDVENSPQSNYRLQISPVPLPGVDACPDCVVDYTTSQSVSSGDRGTSSVLVVDDPNTYSRCKTGGDYQGRCIEYRGEGNLYYWRIKVKDGVVWSDWVEGSTFDTPSHAYPWVDFSWCPLKLITATPIQFCSISDTGDCDGTPCAPPSPQTTCYDADNTCNSWTWDFQDAAPPSPIITPNATVQYPSLGERTVTLEVCDEIYCCPKERDVKIRVELPLPEWKEIPPTF